jgi:hypothetical protein
VCKGFLLTNQKKSTTFSTMKNHTQFDMKLRVVALENLRAMLARASSTCHRFSVARVSAHRCYVEYSNPDEYGTETPMTAVYPVIPNPAERSRQDNPLVVLGHLLTVQHDNWGGEGWQAFERLTEAETLWRAPDGVTWRTEDGIRVAYNSEYAGEHE